MDSFAPEVERLKQLMVEATDLCSIYDHFDRELVMCSDFLDAGVRRNNDRLVSIARLVVRVSVRDEPLLDALLLQLPTLHLWHGVLTYQRSFAPIIYFDDVNCGLLTVCRLASHEGHFFRFSIPESITEPIEPEDARLVFFSRRHAGSKAN